MNQTKRKPGHSANRIRFSGIGPVQLRITLIIVLQSPVDLQLDWVSFNLNSTRPLPHPWKVMKKIEEDQCTSMSIQTIVRLVLNGIKLFGQKWKKSRIVQIGQSVLETAQGKHPENLSEYFFCFLHTFSLKISTYISEYFHFQCITHVLKK